MYHAMVRLHEQLPQELAAASILAVLYSAGLAWHSRLKFAALLALAQEPPSDVRTAFAGESTDLAVAMPLLEFLPVDQPLCFAFDSKTIVMSRGFFEGLDAQDIRLVARHELLHLKRQDPLQGILWHVIFAGLLFPAFDGIERKLSLRRERNVHLLAGQSDPERYSALLRCTHLRQAICVEPALARRSKLETSAPVIALILLLALMCSHMIFLSTLQYLLKHHC